ncbi:MAG TPA: SMP-30/gluconolactonase/LRE family protein [Caulobacteraceae bacterium]|jgi:sugar lactone lactonase YvrE|nr:SMP-30/gluconolactonase/LRE family protein [Caulobacteraceae bacterium]
MARDSGSIETVLDLQATIGESPLWSSDELALYWVDIKKPALYRFEPATGAQRSWALTSDVGGFALVSDPPGALVALRTGLHRLDFASGALAMLAPAPFDPAFFRFNEGACDAQGRFWIGVMFDPLEKSEGPRRLENLHSFTLAGGLRQETDRSALHNGMAWSPDGRRFYLSHSFSQQIFVHDYTEPGGTIGEGRVFAKLPEAAGIPDGAAMDTDGGYWCACHGGGRLRRYDHEGAVDVDIPLPVSQPTMCAFGGEHLLDLYVTSARDQLSAAQLEQEPLAGGLLRLRPGRQGAPRHCFAR